MQQNKNLTVYIVIGVAFGILLVLMLFLTSQNQPEITPTPAATDDFLATVDARIATVISTVAHEQVAGAMTEAGISITGEAQNAFALSQIARYLPTFTPTPTITPTPTETATTTPPPTPLSVAVGQTDLIFSTVNYANRVVAWSPDSQAVVGGDIENNVVLGTIADGNTVVIGRTDAPITTIDWTSDSRRIAAADEAGGVYIWDLQNAAARTVANVDAPIQQVAWSPNGTTLAGISLTTIYLWDVSLVETQAVALNSAVGGGLSLSWSPDASQLAISTGTGVNLITLFDNQLVDSRPLANVETPRFVTFSPDGSRLAVADGLEIKIFNTDDDALQLAFPAHIDTIVYLSWSPNGEYLASAGADGMVRVWEAATGLQRYILLHTLQVTMAEWSPDGNYLATKENALIIWELPLAAGEDAE